MSNTRFSKFNDGVVRIYREKQKSTDFNAKKNVKKLEDMDFIVRLDYEEASRREQDLEFAEQRGCTLSLKLHTRFVPTVDNKCMAVIDGYLYDIWYVDKSRPEMWLFVEGVRKLDT